MAGGILRFRREDVERVQQLGPVGWGKDTGTYLVAGTDGHVEVAPAYTVDGLMLDDDVNPRLEPDRWMAVRDETARICGGDDFFEGNLPIPAVPHPDARWLVMEVSATQMAFSWAPA